MPHYNCNGGMIMHKRTLYGEPKDPWESDQEKSFYNEEPQSPTRKLTKEDLDTLDGWKEDDTR